MGKYILKRLGYMLVVLIILSFLLFLIYNLVPSNRAYTDANEQVKTMKHLSAEESKAKFNELYKEYQIKYGTDTNNKLVRYRRWVGVMPNAKGDYIGLLQGNFGYSYQEKDDVVNVIPAPMKNTVILNIFSTILALGITIPLGILCAVKKGSRGDKFVSVFTIIGYSLPVFLIAILFIWLFCSKLHWFPPSGMKTLGVTLEGWAYIKDRAYYLALPLITMTFCSLGSMTRYVRASMIDSLSLDCIKTARAKGVREKVVIFSHAFRNALIPIVTLVIGWFLSIFSGSLMIENMFGLNGMGDLMITSLRTSDFDVIMILQVFYVTIALLGNLIIDIAYGLVDPRVRVNK
ncbi:MAG: ABC transporter permease [Clostridia bacterium]|nr:ABC transporter permease [Clostridia bacterium]